MASALPNTAHDLGDKPLLAVLRGERRDPPPMWLMRQAGRYLPEYRELRATKGGFLELAYDPEAAAEITLQPLRRFAFDGAILFSDILVVPHAMGMDLSFTAGEGPRLAPRLAETGLADLQPAKERLDPIYETVRRVKAELKPETTFLGFAGSPWTVATYMIAGQGSREQAEARQLGYADPGKMEAILDLVAEVTVDYLSRQIEAGVDAVQLFDSWAGSVSPNQFERFVIARTAWIVERLKKRHPETPIIPMKSCLNLGPPSSEGTEAICRVPSGDFSQAPWYTLPSHLCRFRVRSIMEGLFPGTSSKPDQSNKVRQFTRSVTHLQAHEY